jgi:hypothetical protein
MKTTLRILACAAILGIGATNLRAQAITIDTTDIKAMFAVGMKTTYRGDTLATTANIGAPGASSWDFSALLTHTRMSLRSVPVASTPYYATSFPGATHALSDTAFSYSFNDPTFGIVLLKGTGFNYFALGQDLLDYGFKGSGNAYLYGSPYPAQGQWIKSPPATYYSLPLQTSKSWITTYDETLSGSAQIFPAPAPPVTVGPTVTAHTVKYTVDAYGPLTVRGSAPVGALRIRKVDSLAAGLRVSYIFLAKDGTSVQVSVMDPMSPDSGTVAIVRTSTQWTTATAVSVEANEDLPTTFALGQNYPNPFNPKTVVSYQLPVVSNVRLEVYDLLGREVALLVNERQAAGSYNVTFDAGRLASGTYLYRITAGQFVQTRKMVLLK